ncbi:MAG TPA: glycosyltransferase, partial [Saprospiraceae bacterium]|nr:glycosyltransferase [Saprospiraceae bacterium]
LTMLAILLAFAIAVYLIMMLALRIGLERSDGIARNTDYEPTVSIIVAARNEEQCIEACIESLLQIDYPTDKLECIIVNDGSTDRTAEIARLSVETHPSKIRVINAHPGKDNLLGKTNAVAQGIEVSRGEVLMFTDADCTVPATWVRSTVRCFTGSVGVVGGFTLLKAETIFEGIQALDWIFLFGIASAMAGLRKPLTVIGNNLSVLRCAYNDVGGFQSIPFSVTEDYALVQAVLRKTNYRVAFPIDSSNLVRSIACRNVKQLFRQKQRWGVGGLDMVLRGMFIMSIGWIMRILLIASFFTVQHVVLAFAVACVLFIDMRFLFKPLKRIEALTYLKYFLFFELYYLVYVPMIPIVAIISKNVVWKERGYKTGTPSDSGRRH